MLDSVVDNEKQLHIYGDCFMPVITLGTWKIFLELTTYISCNIRDGKHKFRRTMTCSKSLQSIREARSESHISKWHLLEFSQNPGWADQTGYLVGLCKGNRHRQACSTEIDQDCLDGTAPSHISSSIPAWTRKRSWAARYRPYK